MVTGSPAGRLAEDAPIIAREFGESGLEGSLVVAHSRELSYRGEKGFFCLLLREDDFLDEAAWIWLSFRSPVLALGGCKLLLSLLSAPH